jgi:hypothetical protein
MIREAAQKRELKKRRSVSKLSPWSYLRGPRSENPRGYSTTLNPHGLFPSLLAAKDPNFYEKKPMRQLD